MQFGHILLEHIQLNLIVMDEVMLLKIKHLQLVHLKHYMQIHVREQISRLSDGVQQSDEIKNMMIKQL
jgi:hypothetical protein